MVEHTGAYLDGLAQVTILIDYHSCGMEFVQSDLSSESRSHYKEI